MAYSQESDLNLSESRLIELTDSADAPGVKDATLMTRLQIRATNRIDAALYGKYVTPVVVPPPILTIIEADIWRYYLYEHRETMNTPDTVTRDYEAAIKLLEDYRTGVDTLMAPHVQPSTGPDSTGGSLSADTADRVFGRAKDGLF